MPLLHRPQPQQVLSFHVYKRVYYKRVYLCMFVVGKLYASFGPCCSMSSMSWLHLRLHALGCFQKVTRTAVSACIDPKPTYACMCSTGAAAPTPHPHRPPSCNSSSSSSLPRCPASCSSSNSSSRCRPLKTRTCPVGLRRCKTWSPQLWSWVEFSTSCRRWFHNK